MSGAIHPADLLDVLDAISFDDERIFRMRQALVAEIGIDELTLRAVCGLLHVMPLAFDSPRFDIEIQGIDQVPAVMIGALDGYEAIVDLVAWPIDDPTRLTTYAGHVEALGLNEALDDSASLYAPPLKVHRTALGWLKACAAAGGLKGRHNGFVPIDVRRTARALLDVDDRLEFEGDDHGLELRSAMMAFVDLDRFLVRLPQREVA